MSNMIFDRPERCLPAFSLRGLLAGLRTRGGEVLSQMHNQVPNRYVLPIDSGPGADNHRRESAHCLSGKSDCS